MDHNNNDQFPMDANFGDFYNSGRMPRAAVGPELGGPPRFEGAPAPPHQLWGLNGARNGGGEIINQFLQQQPLYFPVFGTGEGGGLGFAPAPPQPPPPSLYVSDMDLWWYTDPFGDSVEGGPFHTDQMADMHLAGHLPSNTLVRRNCDYVFIPLLHMTVLYGRNPFIYVLGSPPPPPPIIAVQTHFATASWPQDPVGQSNQFQEAEEPVRYGQPGDSGVDQAHRSSASNGGDTPEYDQRQEFKVEAASPKAEDVSSSSDEEDQRERGVSNGRIIDTSDGGCGCSGPADLSKSRSCAVNPARSGPASGMSMRSQVGSKSIKEEACHSEKSTASDESVAKTGQSEKSGKEGTKIPKIDSGVGGGPRRRSRMSTLRSPPGKKVKKEKHAQPPKVYKCDLCPKTYMSRTGVYAHKKNKHSDSVKSNKNGSEDNTKISVSASTAPVSDPDRDNYS